MPERVRKPKVRQDGEGSIYPFTVTLKSGVERVYWKASVRHEGKRLTLSSTTRAETLRKLRTLQRDIEDDTSAARGKQTVAAFAAEWLESSVRPTVRPRTYRAYAERLKTHVLPTLGRLKLKEITPRHIQRLWASKLEDGLSSSTVNGVHVVVHRMLKQALRWNLVRTNAAEGVDVPQPKPTEVPKPFDALELAAFLQGTRDDDHGPLWVVLLTTGLRFGEAAALRWTDIDFPNRVLHVRSTIVRDGSKGYSFDEPKTAKSKRTIPLPVAAIVALRRQQQQAEDFRQIASVWEVQGLVFPSRRGTPMREPGTLQAFHAALERLGLPRRRLHDLRHTYATQLYALATHPRAVQELLGHADIGTSMNVYTGAVPAVLREAVDNLDRTFGA